jgi:two-component system, response regulator PdtaR
VGNIPEVVGPYVVLVVEDEFFVRMVAVEALTEAGFTILEAERAADAMAVLHSRASDIHALFTDVQMPGEMDGVMLAHEAFRRWPWIGILITSGYTHHARAAMPAASRYLHKPYDLDHVIQHIHELVSG